MHQLNSILWFLMSHTKTSTLNLMTQFKDNKHNANAALYNYPVLMAADVLCIPFKSHIPVGEDQKQHVEYIRDLAEDANKYCNTFHIPEYMSASTPKVYDLQEKGKMSKSNPDKGTIFLNGSDDNIAYKIRIALTDSLMMPTNIQSIKSSRPEVYNLCSLYSAVSKKSFTEIEKMFANLPLSTFKNSLTEELILFITPIRNKINQTKIEDVTKRFMKNKSEVRT